MNNQDLLPVPGRTPTRHRLLAMLGRPDNGFEALVDIADQEKIAWRLDGQKVHGAFTQQLTLLWKSGLLLLSTPKPMRWHEPRTISLTDLGAFTHREWTARYGPIPLDHRPPGGEPR